VILSRSNRLDGLFGLMNHIVASQTRDGVTARKRNEAALTNKRTRYESLDDGVFFLDHQSRLIGATVAPSTESTSFFSLA
jgi:hypothetical protein